MRYIKTYEGLFDFFKKKSKSNIIGKNRNIVTEYSKYDVVDIMQELNDDLDLDISSNSVVEINASNVFGNVGVFALGVFAHDYFSEDGVLFIDYTMVKSSWNCYEITIRKRLDDNTLKYIKSILESKCDLYEFGYMISNSINYLNKKNESFTNCKIFFY